MTEIVVGLDDSPSAAAALRWAVEQSRVTGLPLRALRAWQLTSDDRRTGSKDFAKAASADVRAQATHRVMAVLGEGASQIRWSLDVVEGPAGPALVKRSRGARLLVLGACEHAGLRRVAVGSVSHYCLSHAEPPIVAVPADVQ